MQIECKLGQIVNMGGYPIMSNIVGKKWLVDYVTVPKDVEGEVRRELRKHNVRVIKTIQTGDESVIVFEQ